MHRRGRWLVVLGAIATVVIVAVIVGFKLYRDKLTVALPDYPPISKVEWLEQGWKEPEREWFHHANQGTQTFNMPYEWFVALEQPRISLVGDVGRLSDSTYLDRFGFIPGATKGGENQLPVGFARGDIARNEIMLRADTTPWINPETKAQMAPIGLTCAACHTGRLTYRQTTLLVDGGPALTDLGKFRQALGISVLFTRLVPGRFSRFANNVLGEDATPEAKAALRKQLDEVWDQFNSIRKLDKKVARDSVDEGYGRLDALNRIGNQVFSISLGAPDNYAATTAPVNYPHIWDTSWFDWVQYNASIEQPMVRNAGEALGVSALINLTRPDRGLYYSVVQVRRLAEMEKLIAGPRQPADKEGVTGLRSPRWPESILGPIDRTLAGKGAALYDELCKGCHLPPVGAKAFWDSDAWRPTPFGQRHLHVKLIDIKHIGTDPAQAQDMKDRVVAVPGVLGIKSNSFGPALGELVEKAVTHWYDTQSPPVPPEERDAMNGYRPNGIQAPLAYKVRPLNGVWATPPFLHNGSVPNVYALLSPVSERPGSFYLGRREFDPVCMGYQLTATVRPADKPDERCLAARVGSELLAFNGGSEMDTTIRGNRNTGHEFNDGPRENGIIGRKLKPDERRALVEFLKTDCVNGPPKEPTACDFADQAAKAR
jgi:hypothetical protein